MVNDKKSLEKSDPPFVCVEGKGCGQVRTREGVHLASWTAKPEMMSVVHDDRGRAWAQPQKQTLAAFRPKSERSLPDTADRLQSVGSDFQGTVKRRIIPADMKIYLCV